jgi:hypothetical protein
MIYRMLIDFFTFGWDASLQIELQSKLINETGVASAVRGEL